MQNKTHLLSDAVNVQLKFLRTIDLCSSSFPREHSDKPLAQKQSKLGRPFLSPNLPYKNQWRKEMLGLKIPQGLHQVFLLILFIKIHHTWHAAAGPMEDKRELENSEFFKKNQHIPTPGNRHGDESRL